MEMKKMQKIYDSRINKKIIESINKKIKMKKIKIKNGDEKNV